ncbi:MULTISPECIES: PQQ-binding-like beta-propeller repeat protein [unclassified Streptomyces]|uniref:outer membrane protein assembly factor BamB family protein n=1 Tax=unclassified Streptomyces TaxID=2593676 RepID=UPI0038094C3C
MRQGSHPPHLRTAAATATALLLLLAGCGGEEQADGKDSSEPGRPSKAAPAAPSAAPAAPSAAPRAHDPVTGFAAAEESLQRDGEFALHDTTIWVAEQSGLDAYDTVTGDTSEILAETDRAVKKQPRLGAPVIARTGDRTVVLSVAPVSRPGSGTHVTTYAVVLLAADARTREKLWSTEIPSEGFTQGVDLKVAGVDGDTAVVVDGWHITAVNLTTHRSVWSKPHAPDVVAVGGGTIAVAAQDEYLANQVYGLSVANGERTWTEGESASNLHVTAARPGVILVTRGSDYGRVHATLVSLATGRPVARTELGATPDRCLYDEQATLVCVKDEYGYTVVAGLDAISGKKLWELPMDDRVAPAVSAVRHGIVYGKVGDEALMLDARTGEDRPGALPDAPDLVNAYVGVFLDDERGRSSDYVPDAAVVRNTAG